MNDNIEKITNVVKSTGLKTKYFRYTTSNIGRTWS